MKGGSKKRGSVKGVLWKGAVKGSPEGGTMKKPPSWSTGRRYGFCWNAYLFQFFITHKWSCGKVMFLHVSVNLFIRRGLVLGLGKVSPPNHKSRRYASYWNALLFSLVCWKVLFYYQDFKEQFLLSCCSSKTKGGNSRHAVRFIQVIQVKGNPLVQNWINNSSGCSESDKITMKNDLSVREYVQKHQVFIYVNPMHTKGQRLKPELAGQVSFCFETKKCHVTRHWKIHPHLV